MTWKVALYVLVVLLAMVPSGVGSTAGQPTMVTLTVTVGLVAPGGAAMGPADSVAGAGTGPGAGAVAGAGAVGESGVEAGAVAAATPPLEPLAGVDVRAVAPGDANAPPEATAVTDVYGIATLQLGAGPHWIFVPCASQAGSGLPGAMLSRMMPDGTLAPMWSEVDLSDGNPAAITLVGTQLNP